MPSARFSWLLAGLWLCACAPKTLAPSAAVDAAVRMAAADALIAAGCLDCLNEAYAEYSRLAALPEAPGAAADSAVRAAILIALRENELALPDSGRLQSLTPLLPSASPATLDLLDMAQVLSPQPRDVARVVRSQVVWAERLRGYMPRDLTATYLWLTLACGPMGSSLPGRDDRATAVGDGASAPLIEYQLAAFCAFRDRAALEPILDRDPRFREVDYALGLVALSGQPQLNAGGRPDLEEADRRFSAAYDWRPAWPALTLAIANVALTAEDLTRAFEFFDRTLTLSPNHPDALLGKIRTLTYLNRHDDAIAVTDTMLMTDRSPGEARYWRAYNEFRLGRDEAAWADVELASATLINADVPKLAGLVAINRRQFDTARERLVLSLTRRPADCETAFYLQAVWTEQRQWREVARSAVDAAACLDAEEQRLGQEIESLLTSDPPSPRRERQISRRETQRSTDLRLRASAWFNAAAANFNLANRTEARRLAEKLSGDVQFGARARALIDRLDTP